MPVNINLKHRSLAHSHTPKCGLERYPTNIFNYGKNYESVPKTYLILQTVRRVIQERRDARPALSQFRPQNTRTHNSVQHNVRFRGLLKCKISGRVIFFSMDFRDTCVEQAIKRMEVVVFFSSSEDVMFFARAFDKTSNATQAFLLKGR